jgi:predicted small lipoprotein YifL
MTRWRLRTIIVIAYVLLTLTGCGQMGPLMLPDQPAQSEEDESDDE